MTNGDPLKVSIFTGRCAVSATNVAPPQCHILYEVNSPRRFVTGKEIEHVLLHIRVCAHGCWRQIKRHKKNDSVASILDAVHPMTGDTLQLYRVSSKAGNVRRGGCIPPYQVPNEKTWFHNTGEGIVFCGATGSRFNCIYAIILCWSPTGCCHTANNQCTRDSLNAVQGLARGMTACNALLYEYIF